MLIVMGGFNAKVGNANKGIERFFGQHGITHLSQNGERIIELCEVSYMCIANTSFPHKEIHKVTWNSPDGKTKNKLNHSLINNRYQSSHWDVSSYRGADVGSDHCPCIAVVKMKLKRATSPKAISTEIDLERLNEACVKEKLPVELNNRFSPLQFLQAETLEERWQHIRNAVVESATQAAGYKQKQYKPWMTDDTWKNIHDRGQVKLNVTGVESARVAALREAKELYKVDKKISLALKRLVSY